MRMFFSALSTLNSSTSPQGNYDEFRFFTGLRPSEQIALVVSDYDFINGVLSITTARVSGIDRDRTKIDEDRRVVLNARARAVLECQLRLRERLERVGRIEHEHLFSRQRRPDSASVPGPSSLATHAQRLAIRYRRPYAARHSSVSWDLMLGGNPLYVAQQHGHPPHHDADHLCSLDGRDSGGGCRDDPPGHELARIRGPKCLPADRTIWQSNRQ
jgi:integrase